MKRIIIALILLVGEVSYANDLSWYAYQKITNICLESEVNLVEDNYYSLPNCLMTLQKDNDGWYMSVGPWRVNRSHQMTIDGNGYGYVNKVAFAPIDIDLSDKKLSVEVNTRSIRTVEAYSREGLKKSHIYFGFKTKALKMDNCISDCIRQSSYILTKRGDENYQFEDPDKVRVIELDIASFRTKDWTCLGGVKESCLPIEKALQHVEEIGFIAAPVNSCITNRPREVLGRCDLIKNQNFQHFVFNLGQFRFKNFKIE